MDNSYPDLVEPINDPNWHMGPCQQCKKYYATRYCVPCYKELCELCDTEKPCCITREIREKAQKEKDLKIDLYGFKIECAYCNRVGRKKMFYKCYTCEYRVCDFCIKIRDFDDDLPECRECYNKEKEIRKEENERKQLLSFFSLFEEQ